MMIATLSLIEVCEALGCKRSKVFELLAQGVLARAPLYGRSIRIYADSVNRALMPKKPKGRKPRAPRIETVTLSDFAEYLT